MVSAITILENAEKVVEKRRGESKTYTEPLPDNDPTVHNHVTNFYQKQLVTSISLKGMRDELLMYPETIGEHYKLLVPNVVSFDAFFCRYYYRCCVERVVDELKEKDISSSMHRGSYHSHRFNTSSSSLHMRKSYHSATATDSDSDGDDDDDDDDGFVLPDDEECGI